MVGTSSQRETAVNYDRQVSLAGGQALICSNTSMLWLIFFLTSPYSVLFSEPEIYIVSGCVSFIPTPCISEAEDTGERVVEHSCQPGLLVLQTHETSVKE